jgi:uncharacterized protein YjdB
MKMKLTKYLWPALAMVLSLVGCNDSSNDSTTSTAPPTLPSSVSLYVSPAVSNTVVGQKLQYNATLTGELGVVHVDVTSKATWESTNPAVATVDRATGVVTAVAAGKTTIVATYLGTVSNAATLTVNDIVSGSVKLTGIDVSAVDPPAAQDLVPNVSVQLRAVGNLSDGSKVDMTSAVLWSAVTPATIAVDGSGLATAIAVGAATVSATYSVGPTPVVGTISGTVVAAAIQSLIVDGANEAPLGVKIPLAARAVYANNSEFDVTKQATWTSDNPAVATVDAEGIVSGVAEGEAIITATFGGLSTTLPVRYRAAELVSLKITDVGDQNAPSINGTTKQIYLVDNVSYPDDPGGLSPNAYYPMVWAEYSDGSVVYVNQDAFWWSSNQEAAYVNFLKGSFVFGRNLASGVEITASYGGKSASFKVDVLPPAGPTLTGIELQLTDGTVVSGGSINLAVGAKRWVTAYGNYSDGSKRDINAKVFYSSDTPRVAVVLDFLDSNIRGISPGTALITAEWQGKTATVTAIVGPAGSSVLERIEIQDGYCQDGGCPVIDTSGTKDLNIRVGEVRYITAWGIYSDSTARVYINNKVFWTSANPLVASMPLLQTSSNVTGRSAGNTTVSARLDAITGSATVNVLP